MRTRPVPAGPDDEDARREARALADPTRRALLRLLVDAGRPLPVTDLTAPFDVHHTAIRQHLGVLMDTGLVTQQTSPPSGRGRPRLVYEPSPRAGPALDTTGRYRELSMMLAEAVRTGTSARTTGRRTGERVAEEHAGADAVSVIVDEARRLGFRPRAVSRRRGQVDVVLDRCPFEDVAAQDPATVCQLHLGLAEGIASSLGGAEVEGIDARDPRHAGCRIHVRRTPSS